MRKILTLSFTCLLSISLLAQEINKHIVVGLNSNISISEKSNFSVGTLYIHIDWQQNKNNSIVAGISNSRVFIKQFGAISISSVTAGWRYLISQDEFYLNFNAGIVQENYISRYYLSKPFSYNPTLELTSGYYIPFKGYKIDVGLGYDVFF